MKPQKSASKALRAPQKSAQRASRGSLHRIVAQDIGARILNGEFAPGTLLPNEADWCKGFGVRREEGREKRRRGVLSGLRLVATTAQESVERVPIRLAQRCQRLVSAW